jgi:hypothetical protein
VERVDPNALESLEVKRFHQFQRGLVSVQKLRAVDIIPKSYSFYTKVAKSAKELTAADSFFADLATFV